MARAGKITRLDNLDTNGVAIVHRGANNKRIALSKRDGADVTVETIEELFLEIIAKGDMDLDEQAVDDMCAKAGLDPQAAETFKAIMKLAYAYRDSDAMKGLLKQTFAMVAAPGKPGEQNQPGGPAQAGAPTPQPGTQGQGAGAPQGQGQPPVPGQNSGDGQPGSDAPTPGAQHGQAAGPDGKAPGMPPGMQPPGGKAPGAGADGDEEAKAQAELKAAEDALAAEGVKPGDAGADEPSDTPPPKGDKTKEPPMDLKEKEKLEEATKSAVAKAAAAEAKIAEQDAVIKSQSAALKANTDAVKKMQDDLRLSQWVSKADKDLSFISGQTAEELGQTLFDIDTHNPELAKKQFELLKGQSAIVKSSGMFRPSGIGAGAGRAGNALEEIEKKANEIVSKSGAGKSREVAVAEAQLEIMKADPALYKRYCDEQEDINRDALRGRH